MYEVSRSPCHVVESRRPLLVVLIRKFFRIRRHMSEEVRPLLGDAVEVAPSQSLQYGCMHILRARYLDDLYQLGEDTSVVYLVLGRLHDVLIGLVEDSEDHIRFLLGFLYEHHALFPADDDRSDDPREEDHVASYEHRHVAFGTVVEEFLNIALIFGNHLNALFLLHLVFPEIFLYYYFLLN